MATSSPPASPVQNQRPTSIIAKATHRSSSRLSMTTGKNGAGSRASDEDSRTAVKVAVRVRPPLNPGDPGYDLIPQRFQRSMVHTSSSNTSLAIDSPHGRKLFVFDRVFAPDVMQEGIWEYLHDSVNAFTQGYNVSLLAYGQSGAGKSYTMGTAGPTEQDDETAMGVIPRAAKALFEALDEPTGSTTSHGRNSMSHLRSPRGYGQPQNSLGDRNWSLKATYVEIYNETLRDLLIPDTTPMGERSNVAIREDVKGNIILTGLRQVDITCVEDLMNALSFGSSIRQTDATAINAKSSRSHAVFSLQLVQRKSRSATSLSEKRFSVPIESMGGDASVTTNSKLHFVDLAGSERLKNTGAHGERAKEGISINAGLASLGKVISQLSSRQAGAHVSYRDSKLTRLLQDSLGGNAVTYMIACVTPAEFHLSETLNTVQYAQRARAIQSKPRIQQVDDGDKQAAIDRLKAEVAFLREQISNSSYRGEPSPRRIASGSHERPDRQSEREAELQDQLLNIQENYTALNQRHAKLIAEMAKARENECNADNTHLDEFGDRATDRLNRSNSFAQAVEQVVLEYEKTIQSLEQSLSSTRSNLSNAETTLLERETKCAYAETINTQLQARLQKLMDREASTENYLHDLETKLDGHTSGEEKNATIIMELRKEISRVRDNEAACEDYISTLEERLAESDQDTELMQREIDRLEQVVERQRSLGKLDSLLHELDQVQDVKQQPEFETREPLINGVNRRRSSTAGHSRAQSNMSRHSQMEDPIPEDDEEEVDCSETKITTVQEEVEEGVPTSVDLKPEDAHYDPQSPAQIKYVSDKLENVTQELIGLRVEHESTIHEYDSLHSKYEEAIRKISELQDTLDETRHRKQRIRESVMSDADEGPGSFASEAMTNDSKQGVRSSVSRSLSSELSSALSSPVTTGPSNAEDASDDENATTKPDASTDNLTPQGSKTPLANGNDEANELLAAELNRLQSLAEQREAAEKELASKYAELKSKHAETLDVVEELKAEVSLAKAAEATSPRTATPVIRRKSSQNLMVDRAQRSFSSLRNIAIENFEGNPELKQNFEINLNAAMHELQARTARIQELEADVAAAKSEMDMKMTIISGLTRERSSLKASPIDVSMMANMRDSLAQNEKLMMEMRQAHAEREDQLMTELETLRKSIQDKNESAENESSDPRDSDNLKKIAELEAELSDTKSNHQAALSSITEKDAELCSTIRRFEDKIASLTADLADSVSGESTRTDQSPDAMEAEKKQQNLISFLRSEVDEYKALISSNAARVAEPEMSNKKALSELEALTMAHSTVTSELGELTANKRSAPTHTSDGAELVSQLEKQIATLEESAQTHQVAIKELRATHAKELADLKTFEQKGYEEQVEVLLSEHAESMHKLEMEVSSVRNQLVSIATLVAGALCVDVDTEKLLERIQTLANDQKLLADHKSKNDEVELQATKELESAKSLLAELIPETKNSITEQVTVIKEMLEDLEGSNKKNSRLIEELEEQLQNNFEEVQVTNNRLSSLQNQRNSQIEEATMVRSRMQVELDTIREEYASLQAKFNEVINLDVKRSDSVSTIRKSPSHTTLPSPPPAIPLPPLPNGATSPPPGTGLPSASPTRPASKDNLASLSMSQFTEDQEARIRTIEKHLSAERQLTQTLEEALNDLEKQSNKVKADCDAWKKRAGELEGELKDIKEKQGPDSQRDNRWSLQAVEEERKKRQAAEASQRQLEERMLALKTKKKKKGSLNCF